MNELVLNRRQNYRNTELRQETRAENISYLLPDGERRFVRWLGFISRQRARTLRNARPVRLTDITRIGWGDPYSVAWEDVPKDRYIHGCLTVDGAYAICDVTVAIVAEPGAND